MDSELVVRENEDKMGLMDNESVKALKTRGHELVRNYCKCTC